ncbi:MAG: hypothetical protein NHB15_06610 [Methanosarcina barkeri]|nr:hypothetical protein [Methanosarcina sp. ERenArc_MAG2]
MKLPFKPQNENKIMESLVKLQSYVQEIKTPFLECEKKRSEIEAYIENLEGKKAELETSTDISDIDKIVDIESRLRTARSMLDKVSTDHLAEQNGIEVYKQCQVLRQDYIRECRAEVEPLINNIKEHAIEIEKLMAELHSFATVRNKEFATAVRLVRPCVSKGIREKFDLSSSIGVQLFNITQLNSGQFDTWKGNFEKNNP